MFIAKYSDIFKYISCFRLTQYHHSQCFILVHLEACFVVRKNIKSAWQVLELSLNGCTTPEQHLNWSSESSYFLFLHYGNISRDWFLLSSMQTWALHFTAIREIISFLWNMPQSNFVVSKLLTQFHLILTSRPVSSYINIFLHQIKIFFFFFNIYI